MDHQSIRKFIQQSIPQELVNTCIRAGQVARKALAEAAGGQAYVKSAAVFLVFCVDLQRNQQICLRQEQAMSTGFTEQTLIASVDTALFAQNVS